MRVRIFLDFWNFQLNWNTRTNRSLINWIMVPSVLLEQSKKVIGKSGLDASLTFEEIRVYTSYACDNENDRKLKNWLSSFLAKQTGFTVQIRERHSRQKPIFCGSCRSEIATCPKCSMPFTHAAEKGVDSAICIDLMALAWEQAYDAAILVSSDADFVPAVQHLQAKGLKIINATWQGHGHHLAQSCWASFNIDDIITSLKR